MAPDKENKSGLKAGKFFLHFNTTLQPLDLLGIVSLQSKIFSGRRLLLQPI